MSLKLFVGFNPVEIRRTVFPAGETCFVINDPHVHIGMGPKNALIAFNFQNNGELFDLALLVDAVRRYYPEGVKLSLSMPYLPYARQDRVCNKGESLSVKVVADFINSLKFERVFCHDIHSSVGEALLDNLMHVDLVNCAIMLPSYVGREGTALVSPDAGAEKKVFTFAKTMGYNTVIRASKVRNVATMKIERTAVLDPLLDAAERFLIVDDICDGGRTFVELAKAIKADEGYAGQPIFLYVSHGIFSYGMDSFEGLIDKIFVHNLMNEAVKDSPLIQKV